ncbi:MAG: AAA family ATPase, partial [Verrucomicrobiales bacterium]
MPAPSPTLFITGTSTAVGKTYVATLILKGQRASGCDAIAFKPVSCGGREDAEALH